MSARDDEQIGGDQGDPDDYDAAIRRLMKERDVVQETAFALGEKLAAAKDRIAELEDLCMRARDPGGYARDIEGHGEDCARVKYPTSALACDCGRDNAVWGLECDSCGARPRLWGLIKDHTAGDQCPCCFLDDYDCDGMLVAVELAQ